MRKKNVWNELEERLRAVFPYQWPDDLDEDDDKNWYYDSSEDPLIPFITGEEGGCPWRMLEEATKQGIEFVEYEGSFYENVDYDNIPQGTEDECSAIVKVDGEFYKIGLIYTSSRGLLFTQEAFKVSPKTIEVVIYE
jgi:hypothetical protein